MGEVGLEKVVLDWKERLREEAGCGFAKGGVYKEVYQTNIVFNGLSMRVCLSLKARHLLRKLEDFLDYCGGKT